MTLELVIKSGAKNYNVSCESDANVSALKAQLESVAEIAPAQQRLIYSGRVLKDEQTLESYGIKSGHTIHLVKGAKPAASSGTTSNAGTGSTAAPPLAAGQGAPNILSDLTGARYAGLANLPSASMFGPDGGMGPMPDTDQMMALLETPEYAEAMQQFMQDPDAMLNAMGNALPPEQTEQMRQMLRTPEFRQLLSNPQAFRQALRLSQQLRGLTGEGGAAGGMGSFPAPGDPEGGANAAGSTGGSAAGGAGAGAGGAGAGLGAGGLNPFLFGSPFAQQPSAPVDNRPPEERYEAQLRQLNELGFYDFDRNVQALRRSGGNVQGAIEALLDGQV